MVSETEFFKIYRCQETYEKIDKYGINWESLYEIAKDYEDNVYNQYKNTVSDLIALFYNEIPDCIRIVHGRAKNPEHMIEKIIRKLGEENSYKYSQINKSNYRTLMTDLIGIRVLTLRREDWKIADEHIRKCFGGDAIKEAKVYVCYGDREIYDSNVKIEWTNNGYRSQHYIVTYNNIPLEIQVRTLAEEVYGEFDHRVRYPYRKNNKFLKRYNHIIAKTVSELDDLISTCTELSEKEYESLDSVFKEDKYQEWNERVADVQHKENTEMDLDTSHNIYVGDIVKAKLITGR